MKKNNRILLNLLLIAVLVMIFTTSCKKSDDSDNPIEEGTVKDIDGNVYHTVTIGTQVWMVENLKTTRYRNGESIPEITDSIEWSKLTTGARCFYKNNTVNGNIYGPLYNWYAVTDSRNVAPLGWHVPSEEEWRTLKAYLGEYSQGGKLKETGTTYWAGPNEGATNETGFSALPGGFRGNNGIFYDIKTNGFWWSITSDDILNEAAIDINLLSNSSDFYLPSFHKNGGLSVRCIKD